MDRTYIRNQTYASAYKKGNDLYYDEKVWDFQVQEEGAYDFIDAMVKGSGRNIYSVAANVHRETGELEECECECAAFFEYDGICKHCVAVLLEYTGYQERRARQKKIPVSLEKVNGITRGMKQSTTTELKNLLEKRSFERVFPLVCRESYKKVQLQPILTINRREISAEFKIGIDRMYVLKDVISFARRLDEHEPYAYGKKLEFVHSLEAFEPESRELAEFLHDRALQILETYRNSGYGYYYNSVIEMRNVPLDGTELEELIQAVGKKKFLADVADTGEKMWQVTHEKLEQKLSISGVRGGITIKIEPVITFIGEKNCFYFKDEKIYIEPMEIAEAVQPFVACVSNQRNPELYVEQQDIPAFCRELLPALKEFFICEITDFDENTYQVEKPLFKIYLDSPRQGWISCKVQAVYGEKEYSVYDRKTDINQREIQAEADAAGLVSFYCNAYDEKEQMMVLSGEEERLYRLLTEGISKMQEIAEVFISDAIKKIRIIKPSQTMVGISISGNLLELEIKSQEMGREDLMELLSRYNRKKKFYRLKNGDFVSMDDQQREQLGTLCELKEGLRLTDKQLSKEKIQIPRYRAMYLDEVLGNAENLPYSSDHAFQSLVNGIKEGDKEHRVPEELKDILREYQKQGVLWIRKLKDSGFGGILADDMGLGKTLQVIAFLLMEHQEGKIGNSLIVSPASLVYNWKNEIRRFAPELMVKIISGNAQERKMLLESIEEGEILVTSYDLLKRDMELYQKFTFSNEIIDEAQYIKNHRTQASRAVKAIQADFCLALTGTPVENRLSELWSIFDYLMPGFLYEYQRFREEMEIPIVQNQDARILTRLRAMITPFILRRLKRDVLKDLPDKLEQDRYVELEGEQQKLYDAHVSRLQLLLDQKSEAEFEKSKIWVLAELTKLRQICCDPALVFEGYSGESAKLEMCIDTIKNAVDGGHKILLFSQFTTMLHRVEERLKKEKISFYSLTGATNKEKRAKLVQAFNEDDTSVFCISLKAGGTGLNLTSADIVIHYDPWWNLAVQNQATDRAHRIGQNNVVVVYKLIASGTIEENIIKLQEKKKELADQVLSGDGISNAGFTREELQELIRSK